MSRKPKPIDGLWDGFLQGTGGGQLKDIKPSRALSVRVQGFGFGGLGFLDIGSGVLGFGLEVSGV